MINGKGDEKNAHREIQDVYKRQGRASNAFFTAASQWPHIIPSIFIVFVIEVFSFSLLIVVSAATASAVTGCFSGLSFLELLTGKRLSLKALETTQKLERLMAAAPNIGFSFK